MACFEQSHLYDGDSTNTSNTSWTIAWPPIDRRGGCWSDHLRTASLSIWSLEDAAACAPVTRLAPYQPISAMASAQAFETAACAKDSAVEAVASSPRGAFSTGAPSESSLRGVLEPQPIEGAVWVKNRCQWVEFKNSGTGICHRVTSSYW